MSPSRVASSHFLVSFLSPCLYLPLPGDHLKCHEDFARNQGVVTMIQENKLSLDKLKHASVLYFRSRDKAMFFSELQESVSKGVGLQRGFCFMDLLPQPQGMFQMICWEQKQFSQTWTIFWIKQTSVVTLITLAA